MESATITSRKATWRMTRLDSPWVTALFGLSVTVLTWDMVQFTPSPGLDFSWILGLTLAADAGFDHGTEFVFTYGPLGFLELPVIVDGGLASVSAAYLVAARVALAASLLWAARQSLPWIPAALLAFAVAAVVPRAIGSVPLALVTIWCLIALQGGAPLWTRHLVVFGGGAVAALEVLVKLNVGITILLILSITAVALPGSRARNLLVTTGVFLAALSTLWFASGQGIHNLDDYVGSSFQVLSGYGEAMQIEAPVVGWDWAAALAVGLAILAATVYTTAGVPMARRGAILAVVAVVLFSLQKFGFVRHDAGHVGAYFEGVSVIWLALRWRPAARLIPCAALALIALAYFPAAKGPADFTIRPGLALDQLSTLLIPADRAQARDDARIAMRASYGVDGRIIRRIGDAAVDVRPWETGLIWAYGLNWRPLPVIQPYQAYTPALDRLNAEALASAEGPRFILRHLGYDNSSAVGIDGRFTTFDAPREARVMLCRFRALLTTGTHQLLVRSERDRCGRPRPLGSATAAYGEPIAVPVGGDREAVFASIDGAAAEGVEQLRALVHRAAIRTVGLGAATAPLPARNAASGLLISASAGIDFPAPFRLAPNVDTISVRSEGGFATSEGPLRVKFFAVPVGEAR